MTVAQLNKKNNYTRSSRVARNTDVPVVKTMPAISGSVSMTVYGGFNYSTEQIFEQFVENAELTQVCMGISEKSLTEAWENEDDDRWNSFLKG